MASANKLIIGTLLAGIIAGIYVGWQAGNVFAGVSTFIIFIGILVFLMLTVYNVVSSEDIHVIAFGGTEREYRGGDSYFFVPKIMKRNKLKRSVIEIAVPRIKLLDQDNLPFGVEISCKVQISGAIIATRSLGKATKKDIISIVDDTIQSASRSEAMKQVLPTIMRERDEMEKAINKSTSETLARVGIEVVLFDIKNIIDVEGYTVIADMERVKSAELNKIARIAEASQNAEAEIVESERRSEAEVKRQEALQRAETARLTQQQLIAEQKRQLTLKEMEVLSAETKRQAEIEAERITIQATADAEKQRKIAQGDADSNVIRANAEAEAARTRAGAEADAIRLKLEAEAQGTKSLAEALKKFNESGIQVKLQEIQAEAQKDIASSIARGIQNNTKLILPANSGMGGLFSNMVSGITAMKEAGVSVGDVLKKTQD